MVPTNIPHRLTPLYIGMSHTLSQLFLTVVPVHCMKLCLPEGCTSFTIVVRDVRDLSEAGNSLIKKSSECYCICRRVSQRNKLD
jgi:hypothetical protein